MTALEAWKCDRAGCEEESPPNVDPPLGWLVITKFGLDEEDDINLHYCSWECAMHGTAQQLEVEERELEGIEDETG